MNHKSWSGPDAPGGNVVQLAPAASSESAEERPKALQEAADLLAHLRRLDVRLTVDGNRLACSAPKGVLDEQLRAQLASHKAELIELVGSTDFLGNVPGFSEVETQKQRNGSRGTGDGKLSFGQQRLWYFDQFEPNAEADNISTVLRLEGALDRDSLDRALREIVRRHEILRTAILTIDGSPVTRLLPGSAWSLSHSEAPASAVPELIHAELRRPFDLKSGNLFRAALIQTGDLENTLVLVVHRIAADVWSVNVLLRELEALYSTFRAGALPQLPEPQITYSEYCTRQTDWLESGVLAAELPYWKDRLQGATPVEFPLDRARPAVPAYQARRIGYKLSREASASVRDMARREAVTPYVALLSGFYLLLQRYTGQTDLTVGAAIAGPDRPEFENLIGLFSDTLAFRTSLAGDPSIRELLRRVKETTVDGLAHQHVPFERLVSALQPQREFNRAPFFELMFTYRNLPFGEFELPGLVVDSVDVAQGVARFDLTVEAHETEGSIGLDLNYRAELYDEATIQRFAVHFERLLTGMTVDPRRRISELRMLSDGEISGLLAAGRGRIAEYPKDRCVCDWIESQSAASGNAIAVACEGREISYRELSRRSNQLARRLRELGVARGTLVGVCLDRSEEMVIAVLAVWKAGAAYVPLDPQYPADRLAFMAEDAAIPVVLTEDRLRQTVPLGASVQILAIDKDRDTIGNQDSGALPGSSNADDLAYVIFTSGSTGTPKGVQISHRALANFLTSFLEEPGIAPSDRLVSVTTLSFDIAGLEIYLPLVAGARTVIATREAASDGRQLAELLDRSGATVMQATPATWRLLLEAGWKGSTGLKRLICGGEALPQDLAKRLLTVGAELWNAYGPTETTIWSTLQRITAPEDATSIGAPIANTQVLLLDEYKQLVPRGAAGELYIGGDGLARGYLNRIELTRERFADHPFARGERLYRTGDFARWLPGGTLEFLGRMDQQAKIRGFRVELEEIEAALESISGIRQAVVVLRDFGAGDQRLVAYVTLRGTEEIDPLEIRKRLAVTLPEYMIPAHVATLQSIPLTPNGKVDKRALPQPNVTAPARELPQSDIELRVAEVWQEVLSISEVGIHDNFFDIGGHSLLLVQMQSRLRQRLNCELSIQELSRNPTVAAIAEHLSAQDSRVEAPAPVVAAPHWKCLVPVQPKGTRTPLFVVVGFYSPDETQLILSRIVPYLEVDQPIYGFRPRWIHGSGEAYASTEEMARECLVELRATQPSGPYLLAGYCLASSVAVEIARQLVREGEEVRLLALVDAGRPNALRSVLVNLAVKADYAWCRAKHIADVLGEIVRANNRSRKQLVSEVVRRKLGTFHAETADRSVTNTLSDLTQNHWRVLQRYRPEPYPGHITLIVTEKWYPYLVREKSHRFARYMGWQGIAEGGLSVHKLPGDHMALLTVLGRELAELLRQCIDRALQEPRRPAEQTGIGKS